MLSSVSNVVGFLISTPTTSNREMRIASVVDKLAMQGELEGTPIPDVAGALAFRMTRSDSDFLALYVRWRTAHPMIVN